MARVPYPDASTLAADVRETLGKMAPLNIFRMLAGGQGLMPAFLKLGNYLLFKSKLDPILREVAIIRVGVLSKAKYEVHQHERIGRDLGMSEPLIEAMHAGPTHPALTEMQKLVLLYTDEAGDAAHVAAAIESAEMPNLWKPSREACFRIEALPVLGTGKIDLRTLKTLARTLSGVT